MRKKPSLAFPFALIFGAFLLAPFAQAQAPAPAATAPAGQGERRPDRAAAARPAAETGRLPADVVTHHGVDLPGRMLRYKVTAGSLPLMDQQGKMLAEVAYVAYVLDGREPATRPITFVFNGGPGASSAFLHLGVMGPKRLAFGNAGDVPSKPPVLLDNAETWLDFTDLVFIDPPGTGYSQVVAEGDDVRRQFFSVDGDVRALSRVVAKYLARAGRLASPKFIAGESYGGFRAPKIANALQTEEGVGVSGLILISPVIDFGMRAESPGSIWPVATRLPSLVAGALERKGSVTRPMLAEAENYAATDYVLDLLRGPRDAAAVRRMVARVSELTGLDPALVEKLGGRVDAQTFARELFRNEGQVGSAYDVSVSSADPYPTHARTRYEDPILDGATAPLSSAAIDYGSRVLNWPVDGRYYLLNRDVNRRWNWGGGQTPPEAVGDLRSVLALDGKVKVLVAHGFTDLVTPYLESKLILDQLPALGDASRVRLEVFPGGHMFYTRDASRAAFRESVRPLYEGFAGSLN